MSAKCIKCGSLAIGHLEQRYDETGKPLANFTPAVLGVDATTWQGIGLLEAYVCTDCGYLETYLKDPSATPFDKLKGFRWVNEPAPRRGAFR